MIKRVLVMTALLSGSVAAQQNADISETDFSSGAANERLAALGRQAAASGKQLVVTAPQHWHAKIAASIRAGGKADLVLKDGFYETVLVRVEDKEVEAPKPEVKPVAAPVESKPAPAAPVAAKPASPPPPEPVAPVVLPPPAEPVVEPAKAEPVPVVEEAEPEALTEVVDSAASAATDRSVFVGSEPGDVDPVRLAMEKQYNEGRRITERLEAKGLRNGDVIYVRSFSAVVVRREGPRLLRFWLEGPIDLTQSGISAEGSNKYRVLRSSMR